MASDSSDDDRPLVSRGHASVAKVSKAADEAMERSLSNGKPGSVGLSVRNGPITNGIAMDIDSLPNGSAKRKSRGSIDKRPAYKDDSASDDGVPLAKRQKKRPKDEDDSDDEPIMSKKKKLPPSINETSLLESSDDDQPLGTKLAKKKANIEKAAAKEAKAIRASHSKTKKTPVKRAAESDSDEPMSKPKKRLSNGATSSAKKVNGTKKPAAKATPTPKKTAGKAAKKAESAEPGEDDEEEDEYRWWDAPKKEDDSIKWNTLEHNGVMFPPPFERLPKNVKLYYGGTALTLGEEPEEIATFFGAMLHSTQNVENLVFQKNFMADFQDCLKKHPAKDKDGNKVAIKDFTKLDFKPIFEHYKAQNEAKKATSKDEKKRLKEEKSKIEEPFMYCKWDGRKEKVGNFRVEPPGLFRGRGEHPKTGRVKTRVKPEQVTINIGKGATPPAPPAGHKWKAVQHDNKATWLAMWQENINGNYKYVMLAANSAVKGQADFKKFEKARALKEHIDRIRSDYTRELKADMMVDRQRATAMYLIDKFALRAGNEKDTDNEADTVGCCSLKYEHITLKEVKNGDKIDYMIIFDFLGKDSIRFHDEVSVDKQVFKNLKMFKKAPKTKGDDVFDRLNTAALNKHLSNYMPGLTAKVFRTYNASFTMSTLLQELDGRQKLSIAEKVKLYNDCNRQVAVLCNHKRTVGAAHETQMKKMEDGIKGLRYQQWRTKMMMLDLDSKLKKKKGAAYFEKDEELTDEWILEHQAALVAEMRDKITKKFEKENEKLEGEEKKPQPQKELNERLKAATELESKFKKENKSKKVEAEGKSPSVEKLEATVTKIDNQIRTKELAAADKEGNKEVALGTSKINYIDPRLTVVFSKKFDVPIEKFFSKTLREKFNWAIQSVGEDTTWEF